jgi:hypothetical protein
VTPLFATVAFNCLGCLIIQGIFTPNAQQDYFCGIGGFLFA